MAKASDGGAGVVIANLSYVPTTKAPWARKGVLRRTAAEKKCDLPPPAATVAKHIRCRREQPRRRPIKAIR